MFKALIGCFSIVLVLCGLYVAWVLVIYRDISVEILEAKYGGENLQTINVDGVKIRYKDEGQGPVLLLLHSHYYTMRQWQGWVDELKADFRILRYDLTSHGLTGPDPEQDYSYERGVALAHGFMASIGVDNFSIAGSSTGGALAFRYAAQYPQQINKLILINTPGMPKMANAYADKTLPAWGWGIFYLLPEALFRSFLQYPIVDKSLVDGDALREFHEMYRREGNRKAEYLRMSTWDKSDPTAIIANIKAPTLLLWGQKNPQLPAIHVAEFKAKLISAKTVETKIYSNIGHVIPIENPRESALDAKTFLQGSY